MAAHCEVYWYSAVSCAKTAEPIEMQFGMLIWVQNCICWCRCPTGREVLGVWFVPTKFPRNLAFFKIYAVKFYIFSRAICCALYLSPEIIDFSSLASFRRSLETTDLEALTCQEFASFCVFCFIYLVNLFSPFLGFRFYGCLKCTFAW